MLFDVLLYHALNVGSTTLRDPGTAMSAQLTPMSGETILTFHSDTLEVRKHLGIAADASFCDGLVFYRHKDDARPVLLFVELKGGDDVKRAATQVGESYKALRPMIRRDTILRAAIVHAGGSSQRVQDVQKMLPRELFPHLVPTRKGKPGDLRQCFPRP